MNVISIKAFTGSKKNQIQEISPKKLHVFTKEPADNNRANIMIIHLVAEFYQIPPKNIRILTGHHKPNKKLQILE